LELRRRLSGVKVQIPGEAAAGRETGKSRKRTYEGWAGKAANLRRPAAKTSVQEEVEHPSDAEDQPFVDAFVGDAATTRHILPVE